MKYFSSAFLWLLFITTSVISQEKKHVFQSYTLVGVDALAYQFLYRTDSGWEKYIDKVNYGGGFKYSYALLKSISPSIGFEAQFMNGKEEDSSYKTNIDLYHLKLGLVFHLIKKEPFKIDLEADYLATKANIEQYYSNEWEKDAHSGKGIGLGINARYVLNNLSGISFGIYTKAIGTSLNNNDKGGSGYIEQYAGLQVEFRVGYSFEF